MRWHRQFATGKAKNAMAATIMPPTNAIVAGYALQIGQLPVTGWVIAHFL